VGGAGPADASDADLLARHAEGDSAAFGEVVRRHRDRLWAVALRTLGDPEEAADALQDALLSAFRASRTAAYRGDAAVTTWLHRIVVNACLDRVRRARARPVIGLPDEVLPAPGDPYADRDTVLAVHEALATLPVDQRAALVLVDLQGWSVEEAARILGVPSGTVKSRCARGRARLLPLLAPERNRPAGLDVPPTSTAGGKPSRE
jgi:RNA polymerase sigma-70 factor, ECF subfamily